jgi:hypothetical protein
MGSAYYEPKLLLPPTSIALIKNKGKTATGILQFSPGLE